MKSCLLSEYRSSVVYQMLFYHYPLFEEKNMSVKKNRDQFEMLTIRQNFVIDINLQSYVDEFS